MTRRRMTKKPYISSKKHVFMVLGIFGRNYLLTAAGTLPIKSLLPLASVWAVWWCGRSRQGLTLKLEKIGYHAGETLKQKNPL